MSKKTATVRGGKGVNDMTRRKRDQEKKSKSAGAFPSLLPLNDDSGFSPGGGVVLLPFSMDRLFYVSLKTIE